MRGEPGSDGLDILCTERSGQMLHQLQRIIVPGAVLPRLQLRLDIRRRLTGQRMSLLVAREAGPALETIRTPAGLLAQAAKQAGQRERFAPKVQRILEEVGRQKSKAAQWYVQVFI